MAFEPKKKEIREALRDENISSNDEKTISLPVYNDNKLEEKTKLFTFTLQPSVRKKLNIIAREHNYKSASKFLNELIKKL